MSFLQTVISFILVLSVLVFIHELGHFLFAKRAGILVREFAIGFGPKIFAKVYGETTYSIRALPLGGFVRMAGEDAEVVELKTGELVFVAQDAGGKVTNLYLYDPDLNEGLVAGRVIEVDLERQLYIVLEDLDGNRKRYDLDAHAFVHYDAKTTDQIAPIDRQFGSKTVAQKALTIFAGPLFNIVFTVILFAIFAGLAGASDQFIVGKVLSGKPAAHAGIQPGDVITAVDGHPVRNMDTFRYNLLDSKGSPVTMTVQRDGRTFDITLTPFYDKVNKYYLIGIEPDLKRMTYKPSFFGAIGEGFKLTYDWASIILGNFGKLVTGQLGLNALGGPVQMGSITGQAAAAGPIALLKWTALLSLNLGIFNLLPIPALDGSRLLFIGIEGVRGRPIQPNKESMVHLVGFALLMVLMLVVTFNDIKRLFFA